MIYDAFRQAVWQSLAYTPHPDQWEAHNRPERYRFVVAGRRWGKSKEFAAKEVVPDAMTPNRMIWCVAPTYELSSKVFRQAYIHLVHDLRLPTVRQSLHGQYLEFPWGTIVQGKSTDNPDSCIGEGVDLLVVDEFARIQKRVWEEALEPTLLDTRGRFVGITTPTGPNWVKDLYDQGQSNDPDIWSMRSPTWSNPYIDPEDLERLARRWGGGDAAAGKRTAKWRQEIGAEFVIFEGLIYWVYRAERHRARPPSLDAFSEFYGGMDFGYDNPFAFLLLGRHASRWWVLRAVYGSQMVSSEQRRAVRALLAELPRKVRRIFADPSRPDSIEEWRRDRFPIVKADNPIESGIETVSDMIANDELILADHESVDPLEKEFGLYRRPDRKEHQRETEAPLDRDNHACDALRYGIVGGTKLERQSVNITAAMLGGKRVTYAGG